MKKKSTKCGLAEKHLNTLVQLIRTCLSPKQAIQVWIYGSRARGSHQPYSDVDLLIQASPQMKPQQVDLLRERLEESELPFKVDVSLREELYEPYRQEIEQNKVLIFDSEKTIDR